MANQLYKEQKRWLVMEDVFAVIIGAGPAGSSAAYFLSNLGYRAILVDREKFPRERLCRGFLAQDVVDHLKRYWKIQGLEDILGIKSSTGEIYYEGESLTTISSQRVAFHLTMRSEFDMMLVQEAVSAGTTFRGGLKPVIYPQKKIVQIGDKQFRYQIIVAADGIPSSTAKIFGMSNTRKSDIHSSTAFAYEVHIPKSQIKNQKWFDHPRIFFGQVEGYGWYFPKRDYLSVGIGATGKTPQLRKELNRLLLPLEVDINTLRIQGHYIPYGMPQGKLFRNGCFLVGDAANLCEPITEKGIGYAMESSRLLVTAIHTFPTDMKKAAKMYQQNIQRYISSDLSYAMMISRLMRYNTTQRLGMHVLRKSQTVGEKMMLLIAGQMTNRRFILEIIRKSPKYLSDYLLQKFKKSVEEKTHTLSV